MMKTLNIAAIISTAVLLGAGAADAADAFQKNAFNHHFIAKRPYQQVVVNNTQQRDQQWEGATLIANPESIDEANLNQQNKLRLNMLSKRPY
jgi:hypothetical protein